MHNNTQFIIQIFTKRRTNETRDVQSPKNITADRPPTPLPHPLTNPPPPGKQRRENARKVKRREALEQKRRNVKRRRSLPTIPKLPQSQLATVLRKMRILPK